MRKKTVTLTTLCLTTLLCLATAGCGNNAPLNDKQKTAAGSNATEENTQPQTTASSEKVSIVLATNWGEGDSKYDYFYPKFEAFQKENASTMDITLQTYSTEDYKTKIKTQTASGDLPDVFTYWGGAMITDMVDAGLLLNAEDYFADSTNVKKTDFEPSSFGYYTAADDNVYGIPIESTRGVLLANKEIFEKYNLKYPTTYEELKAVSATLNENGIIPMAMASSGGTPSEFFYSELYAQYDNAAAELVELPSTKNFATENALKTARNISDMIADNMFPEDSVANGGWAACLQLYTDGKAAMTYTYPWMFEAIPDEIQAASEIIFLPQMPDSQIDSSTIMSGFTVYGFVINKAAYEDTAKHDAVLKLCDFLASDELSADLTKSGMIPAKNIEINLTEQKVIFQKMMAYAENKELIQVHYTTMPDAAAISMMDSSLDELFIKAITPEEFVEKVQTVLDKNKK